VPGCRGAERNITLSRNPARQELARAFGATDIRAERGEEAIDAVKETTEGVGVDAALECVGNGPFDGDRHRRREPRLDGRIRRGPTRRRVAGAHNVLLEHRVARRRGARPDLHPGAARRRAREPHQSGRVLDCETDLDGIAEAYAAMDGRRAIKSLVRVGTV
jgi:threonine dehydrogenase-like Zn-dependent dehydrogenase